MGIYTTEYEQKLTTSDKAVEVLKSGDTLILGLACVDQPSLLSVIDDWARQGDL